MKNKISDEYYVLNNSGHVSGEARQWKGYRHIALMRGEEQNIIRNTKRARVVADATLFVGSTRGRGYDLLQAYENRADRLNTKLDREFNCGVHEGVQ